MSVGRLRHGVVLAAVVCLLAAVVAAQAPAGRTAPAQPRVAEMRIEGAIHPLMSEFITGGLKRAAEENAALVLITMNTPGGLDSSMRDIIRGILASTVPVAVYVSPSGGRAASAGFFILLSADVAAMAPGTDTGAASPVSLGGQQTEDTLKRKATNEAAAYLRSITAKRGRNPALAELAVTEAKAFSEQEALDGKLVDLVAPSVDELLRTLDGRSIQRFDGARVTLRLAGAERVALEMNRRQRILSYIADPNVVFLLFMVGMLGLMAEMSNPGMVVPGVVGAICLVLAFVAVQILPINAIGVLLIVLAIGLFVLEAKVTSYGLLGLAGVVAMVTGALLLVDSPWTGMGVSLGTALGATIPFALLTIFLMTLVIRSFKWKYSTGVEALVGQVGEVTEEINAAAGTGQVFVAGELWRAAAMQQIPKGARVRVVRVEGLTVHVEPVPPGTASP